jgi:O-antigen ligase
MLGILVLVAYTATLPFLQDLPARAYPIAPFAGLAAVGVAVLVLRYPAALLGAYAGGAFSLPFLLVPLEANPVRGWSLLPMVGAAIYLLVHRRRVALPLNAALVSQLAFAVILLAGVIYTTGSTGNGLEKAWWFLRLNLFLFVSATLFAGDTAKQQAMLASYSVSAVLWAVGVYLLGGYTQGRLGFEDLAGPIVYGRACGIVATLMAAWLLSKTMHASTLIALPVGLFALYGTVLSGTRGALLAFLAALLISIILSQITTRALVHVVFAGAMLVGTLAVVPKLVYSGPRELAARYAELGDLAAGESAAERIYLYMVAARMLARSPVTGEGTGSFPSAFKYPHNIFLEVGAEVGIVGLLAFSTLLAVSFFYVVRALLRPGYSDAQKTTMVMLGAGLAFWLTEAQFSGDITNNRLIWFFCGLISAVHATKAAPSEEGKLARL